MNRLRKIAGWIWYNKERMVLVAMLGFFGYRVYVVLNPAAEEPITYPTRPGDIIDPTIMDPTLVPPPPPRPLAPDIEQDYPELVNRNPFHYYSGERRQTDTGEPEVQVELVELQEITTGRWRAKLEVAGRAKWYFEGDEFDSYRLVEINANSGSVTLQDTASNTEITRSLQ